MGGNNLADVQRITVVADPANANGSAFGGIRAGNAAFVGSSGVVGISAANVAVQDVVTIGDIYATDSASPSLAFGSNSQFGNVTVAGGDLLQGNSKTINNGGYKYDVVLAAGTTSGGAAIEAANTYSQLSFTQTPASVAAAIVPPVVNQTFQLTSGTDTPSGGAGNDVFDGSLNSASAQTLQSTDRLNGGAGSDSLSATINTSVTPASLASIERITLTATANTPTVDLINAGDVTSITSQASTSALSVTNIVSPSVGLTIADGSVNHTFAFRSASVSGTSDSASLTLSNATGGTVTLAGIETVNLTSSSSANTVEVAAANAGALTVSGASNATVTLAGATVNLSSVDASAATGDVTFTLTNQSGLLTTTAVTVSGGAGADSIDLTAHTQSNISASGGAGNDTITLGGNLGTADSIDGGEGTDTLVVNTASANANDSAAPRATITSVEQISITDAFDGTLALPTLATSLNTVSFTYAGANGATLMVGGDTVTGPAGALTVNIGASAAGNTTALGGSLTIGDTGTATTDSLVINNTAVNSTTGLSVNIFNGQNITSSGYENVTIDLGSRNYTSPAQTIGTLTITNDSTTAAGSLTLRGTNDLSITSISTNSSGLLTIDASGINAGLDTTYLVISGTTLGTGGTASITGTAGRDDITVGNFSSTISGGAGNDSITGGTARDNIDGGAGDDTLIGSGGSDTIIGGDGADQITVTTTANVANAASIDGGAGNDLITSSGALSADDTINGGDGTDTLVINDADVTTVKALSITSVNTLNNNISGIEVIRFANGLAQDIDMGRLDGVSNIELGSLDTGAVTISGLAATNSTRFTAALSQTLTLALAESAGSADTINATIAGSGNVSVGTVNVSGVETVAITATDTDAGTADAQHSLTLTDNTATTDVLSTVNISGNAARVTLTLTGSTAVSTLNAGSLSGGLYATALSTGAVTVTGGAGSDSLVGAGGADSISGGNGDDTIAGGLGADTLAGGAGTNTLETSAGITIGTTTDSNGNVAIAGVVVNLGATALSAAAVNTAVGGSNYIAGSLASIPSGSSAYIFGSNTNLASPNVDTISGFTRVVGTVGADYLVGGASAETLTGGAGADTINGGAGTDTVLYSDVTAATSHGLANIAGMAVNLSGSDVTAATIATAMGGNIEIGGGNGVAGGALVAGSAGYLATSAANSTTSMVRDSLTAVENVVGSALRDYIVDGAGSNTITAGAAGDVIVLTAEATSAADTIVIGSGDATATIGGAGNFGTIVGFDTVSGLNASATGAKDILDVAGTAALAAATAGTNGTDSTLTIAANTIKSHAISATGIITFDDDDTYATALTLTTDAHVAAVVEYLLANDIGSAGDTVAFVVGADTYVYTQTGAAAGSHTLVKVVGVTATGLETATSATAARIRIG